MYAASGKLRIEKVKYLEWKVILLDDQALFAGILNGYGDGTFRASRTTTRAEAAAMIYKLLLALEI